MVLSCFSSFSMKRNCRYFFVASFLKSLSTKGEQTNFYAANHNSWKVENFNRWIVEFKLEYLKIWSNSWKFEFNFRVWHYWSTYLFTYSPTYLSIHLYTYLHTYSPTNLCIYKFIHLFTHLPTYLCTCWEQYLSGWH